jgi:hypothetical protein
MECFCDIHGAGRFCDFPEKRARTVLVLGEPTSFHPLHAKRNRVVRGTAALSGLTQRRAARDRFIERRRQILQQTYH